MSSKEERLCFHAFVLSNKEKKKKGIENIGRRGGKNQNFVKWFWVLSQADLISIKLCGFVYVNPFQVMLCFDCEHDLRIKLIFL